MLSLKSVASHICIISFYAVYVVHTHTQAIFMNKDKSARSLKY